MADLFYNLLLTVSAIFNLYLHKIVTEALDFANV